MNTMEAREQQAFQEGRQAFFDSLPASANPYPPLDDRNALWADGWQDARNEYEAAMRLNKI